MTFNLATILRESALRDPFHTALIEENRIVSYGELYDRVTRTARGIMDAGAGQGDAVAVMIPNSIDFAVAYYATLLAGAAVVPINSLLHPSEVEHQVADSHARLLITPTLLAALLAPTSAGIAATLSDDTAVILYTSGSTGVPKGAELTHLGMFMNASLSASASALTNADVTLAAVPLCHVMGQTNVLNATMISGGSVRMLDRFSPAAALAAIERDRVTVLRGVPTIFAALLEEPRPFDTSSLRACSSGGAPLQPALAHAFQQRYSIALGDGYGLTETSSTVARRSGDEQAPVGSVGKPIWGVEVAIKEHGGGTTVGRLAGVGEIVVRGHNVMKGYLGLPEATGCVLDDGGWLRTGDLGFLDSDGWLFVVGRTKELIIRGGYNVYPAEVEAVLLNNPNVAQAAVVGTPDDRLGQEVKAVVVARAGREIDADQLVDWCRQRMAPFKYPRLVEVRTSLPIGPTGKVIRAQLQ